jgi:hypothetical protein
LSVLIVSRVGSILRQASSSRATLLRRGTIYPTYQIERLFNGPEILSGEKNLSHSIANIEHYHFRWSMFRRPVYLHTYFCRAASSRQDTPRHHRLMMLTNDKDKEGA